MVFELYICMERANHKEFGIGAWRPSVPKTNAASGAEKVTFSKISKTRSFEKLKHV